MEIIDERSERRIYKFRDLKHDDAFMFCNELYVRSSNPKTAWNLLTGCENEIHPDNNICPVRIAVIIKSNVSLEKV